MNAPKNEREIFSKLPRFLPFRYNKGLVHLLATHMYIIDIEVTLSTPQSDVTSKSALKVDLGGPVCWKTQ